jgi:hypothetical protein
MDYRLSRRSGPHSPHLLTYLVPQRGLIGSASGAWFSDKNFLKVEAF